MAFPSPTLQDVTVNGAANISTAAITGGAIDGTIIGGTTPASITATNLTASGTVSGTGITNLVAPYTPLSDLAATGSGQGANLVGYLSPLSNAINRTLQSKATDFFNAKDWCVFDGVTDDTLQFQNAVNALSALPNGGCLVLPSGQVKLGAITLPTNVSIWGQGKRNTAIIPASASQICFTVTGTGAVSAQSLRDFSIDCGSIANVIGVSVTDTIGFTLDSIEFVGCLTNFIFDQGRSYRVLHCESVGNATNLAGNAQIWSSSDTAYIYEVVVEDYGIHNSGNGVHGPAIYFRRAIQSILSFAAANDLLNPTPIDFVVFENDCQGCKAIGCVAAGCANGILSQIGTGVSVAPSFIDVISCDIDQPQTAAINFTQANYCKVVGGNMTASGNSSAIGVLVQGTSSDIVINSIDIDGFNLANGAGIYFSGVSEVNVSNCAIRNCYYGIVLAATPTNIHMFNTQFINCTNKFNGTLAGIGNWMANNSNFNPIAVSTPTLPASGVTYQNDSGVPVRVYIVGGTFTAVSVNGTSISTSGPFSTEILPGETIAVTYSVAPTWTWVGL